MAEIQVAPVKSPRRMSKRELYATVCYYYPRYSMLDCENMPGRDLFQLVETAHKKEAAFKHDLTAIMAAPHSEKGKEVTRLLRHFESVAKG